MANCAPDGFALQGFECQACQSKWVEFCTSQSNEEIVHCKSTVVEGDRKILACNNFAID